MDQVDYQAKREAVGLSQAELARRMGFSRPYVSRVESGKDKPGEAFRTCFEEVIEAASNPSDVTLPTTDHRRNSVLRPSLVRSRKVIRDAVVAVEQSQDALARQRVHLTQANKALAIIIYHASVLIEAESGEYSIAEAFDLETATPEIANQVLDYFVAVVAEMMVDHNFHTVSDDSSAAFLDLVVRGVTREVKKANRKAVLPT